MGVNNPNTIGVQGQPVLGGNVVLIPGTNITLTQTGQNITIASSGASWTEVEIDFGSAVPKYDALFTIVDASVLITSKVIVVPSGKVATGRVGDDWQWDGLILAALPAAGSFTLYVTAVPGPVKGARKIQYTVV